MDIHKLEVFIDLAETLNYTETAERQFTTQSNISKQIIALEKELNVQLFERSHRKITVSTLGEIVLSHAKDIISHYHKMQCHLCETIAKEDLSLSILTIPTMANYHGFELITHFIKEHPEVSLELKEGEGDQLFPFLNESGNHLIFARTFHTIFPNFDCLLTTEDHFVAVLSKNHPLASRELINLSELKEENFVILAENTLLYQPIIDLCKKSGFEPQILFKSSRIDLLLNMVESGLGIALLMEKTIEKNWHDYVQIVPITPTQTSYLSFIRKKETPSKASRLLWHYLMENQD